MPSLKVSHFPFGGDYNPDQWTPDIWRQDITLMKALGVNTVTLPVFSWARLQPSEDCYQFEWLDTVMELLRANDLQVIMATPTAAQPAWMSRKYPDILPVDIQGRKQQHGRRTNFCVNSPSYRRFSSQIAHQLAQRYQSYPNLILWHINNEYGTCCYCDNCAAAFRQWLQERYGSLERLNLAWYTSFWGHTLYAWDEVVPPTHLSGLLPKRLGNRDGATNQAVAIDYQRFMSDSITSCLCNEVDAIRQHTPHIPITTNLMGTFKPLDYFRLSAHLDIVSWDSYPANSDPASWTAFQHDLMRGVGRGNPFLLMEQTPNQQNWQPYNTLKRPGVMRLLSYQAMARGADSVLFFQWRQSLGGCEKFHAALVPHAGHLETRIGRELKQLGQELSLLGPAVLGSRVKSRVAVLFDWPNWWAVEYSSGPSIALDYPDTLHKYYRAFYQRNISVDVVSIQADLSDYEVVVAPLLYMTTPDVVENIKRFVAQGGTFITTYMSGLVDENDQVIQGGYPGALRELLGLWVEETDALAPHMQNEMILEAGVEPFAKRYACGLICDVVHTQGARVLATFGQDYYAGAPALTENQYGQGKALYLASDPEAALLEALVEYVCEPYAIRPPLAVPQGVEVTQRGADGQVCTFILNHNPEEVLITLPAEANRDLVRSQSLPGQISLAGKDVLVLLDQIR
jgi:beta-galactosidase